MNNILDIQFNSEEYSTAGLNVIKYDNVFVPEKSQQLFSTLKSHSYEDVTFTFKGKTHTPARKVLCFADEGISYQFSGMKVKSHPWITSVSEIRQAVESVTQNKYNHCLINYYVDGKAGISKHRDAENNVCTSTGVACISFGATRSIIFDRLDGTSSTTILANHNSLYHMKPPTNRDFTHRIPQEETVTECRISLTFRKILNENSSDDKCDRPVKKLKTEFSPESASLEDDRPPIRLDSLPANMCPLGNNIFVTVTLFLGYTQIHIRKYATTVAGTLHPTKQGISLSPSVWYSLQDKLNSIALCKEGITCIEKDLCITKQTIYDEEHFSFQRLFQRRDLSLQFLPDHITLTQSEFIKIGRCASRISDQVKEKLISYTLQYFVKKELSTHTKLASQYVSPYAVVDLEETLCKALTCKIEAEIKRLFQCFGCIEGYGNQLGHECITRTRTDLFEEFFDNALYRIDWIEFAQNFILDNIENPDLVRVIYEEDFFSILNVSDIFRKVKRLYIE